MQPVVDQAGTIVAWLKNSVEIFTPDGIPVGSIQVGYGMYSLDGEFLGYCHKGLFRGPDGRIVARMGSPVSMTSWLELQRFLIRVLPKHWPPVVACENEWSTDWKSVLSIPDRRQPAAGVTSKTFPQLTERGSPSVVAAQFLESSRT